MRTLGLNNSHTALKWLSALSLSFAFAACSDDVPPEDSLQPVCQDGETRNIACGEDDAGTQAQLCVDSAWTNDGDCEIPTEGCTDGDTRTLECGEDNEGEQSQICEDGAWSDSGDCVLPDETCVDGETRTGTCGLHDNGTQPEICENETWTADGDCVDPDACALEDDSNARCEEGLVQGAIIELPASGFWQPQTLDANAPPALERLDAANLRVTDMAGNTVVFDVEEEDNGTQKLTWTHIEDDAGQKYQILRGEYPFYVVDDADETLAQGILSLRGTSDHERTFVFKGFSLHVEHDNGEAREASLKDTYGDTVAPLHTEEGTDADDNAFVRRDYIVPSNTRYRYDVPATATGALGEHRQVFSPANAARYVKIESTPAVIVPYRVTAGAEFGAWVKRDSRHFSRFDGYTALLDEEASDDAYDQYNVYAKSNEEFSVHATLPGNFTKEVLVERHSESPDAPIVIDVEAADPDAVGNNGYMEADIYTNAPHSGVISLHAETTGAQSFTLDVLRVWQAMEGAVMNLFFEPTFFVDVVGDGNIEVTPSKTPGRERFRVDALDSGVSVITIGYAPIRLTQSSSTLFNAIAPDKTAALVVQVGELNEDNIELNIDSSEYDTWYFDAAQSDHAALRVEPTADADIDDLCVHDPLHNATWGEGWNCFDDEDGAYTLALKEGRNIVRARTENSTVYRVVTARGLDITIENDTHPGEALNAGDTAKITLNGLSTPVQKIAGIYNPAFGQVYAQYDMNGTEVKSPGSQFQISTTGSVLTVTFDESGDYTFRDGRIHSNHFGSPLDAHKQIAAEGHGPNLNAPTIDERDFFGFLPDFIVQVD